MTPRKPFVISNLHTTPPTIPLAFRAQSSVPPSTLRRSGIALAMGLLFASPAFAQIVINSSSGGSGMVGHDVCGNGASGSGSCTTPPVDASTGGAYYVNIIGGNSVDGYVAGGAAVDTGNVEASGGNWVRIDVTSTFTILGNVYGGWAESTGGGTATASGNFVEMINEGDVRRYLYGNFARSVSGIATATGRGLSAGSNYDVIMDSGTVDLDVFGSAAESDNNEASAANSHVLMNGGAGGGKIYGGYARSFSGDKSATVTSSSVTVTNNSAAGQVDYMAGGYAETDQGQASVYEGYALIGMGSISAHIFGGVAVSKDGNATVEDSYVRTEGSVPGDAYGGSAKISGPGKAESNRNHLTIMGGYVQNAYGGSAMSSNGAYTATGDASATDNAVELTNGATVDWSIFGGRASTDLGAATVERGFADVNSGGEVGESVYGGYAESVGGVASVHDSAARIEDSLIYGATPNQPPLTPITALTVPFGDGNVVGGFAVSVNETATVTGSSATIDGNSAIPGYVAGGAALTDDKLAKVSGDNQAAIYGGIVEKDVYGGVAVNTTGDATAGDATTGGNSAIMDGGLVRGSLNGSAAWSQGSGTATVAGTNSATMTGGDVTFDVFGGAALSNGGSATVMGSNTAAVSGSGTVGDEIYGGYARSNASTADVTGTNTATMSSSGSVGSVYAAYANGASGATITGTNTATVSRGTVTGDVYGAYAASNIGVASVTGSAATVNGSGSTGSVYGGYASSYGSNAEVTGSTATIDTSSTVSSVYGGYASGGAWRLGKANGNFVNLNGGTVNGNVYGGFSYTTGAVSGEATGNKVILRNSPTLNTASLYGGWVGDGHGNSTAAGTEAFNGNILEVRSNPDLPVHGIYNFARMDFYLPATIGNGDVMLKVTGMAELEDGSGNQTSVFAELNAPGASIPLSYGQQIVLIDSVNNAIAGEPVNRGDSITINYGTSGYVTTTLDMDTNNRNNDRLVLNVVSVTTPVTPPTCATDPSLPGCTPPVVDPCSADPSLPGCTPPVVDPCIADPSLPVCTPPVVDPCIADPSLPGCSVIQQPVTPPSGSAFTLYPETKAYAEGHLAGMTLLNRGLNVVAGQAMRESLRIGRLDRLTGNKSLWATLSAGTGEYETGSHIDMDSVSLMTGITVNQVSNAGEANFGAFIEYGNGSYDTSNKFVRTGTLKGDGKIRYYGVGLLGRMDLAETGSGNAYFEGSLRAGKVKNSYHSGLWDPLTGYGRFKTSANYASLHFGGGYRWKLNDTSVLDFYGQAFYTREGSDSTRLSSGEAIKFSAVNSNRIRLGGRYEWALERVAPYVGLAYEHEFDGKAKATINGYKVDSPDLKGGTGIAEVGVIMKPSQTVPLTLNLGIQGYVGKQEGVTGSLRMKYEF